MKDIHLASIQARRAAIDGLRPVVGSAWSDLEERLDIDYTYASNALSGESVGRAEVAELLRHGGAVGESAPLAHCAITDHHEALRWMRGLANASTPLDETVVLEMHRLITRRCDPDMAGRYCAEQRRVGGSRVLFPDPSKVRALMHGFGGWLAEAPLTPEVAFYAHLRLIAIHPFSRANGRTARLLMNLLLLRAGYVVVSIPPEEAKTYAEVLELGYYADDLRPFQTYMHERLDRTLGVYLKTLRRTLPAAA